MTCDLGPFIGILDEVPSRSIPVPLAEGLDMVARQRGWRRSARANVSAAAPASCISRLDGSGSSKAPMSSFDSVSVAVLGSSRASLIGDLTGGRDTIGVAGLPLRSRDCRRAGVCLGEAAVVRERAEAGRLVRDVARASREGATVGALDQVVAADTSAVLLPLGFSPPVSAFPAMIVLLVVTVVAGRRDASSIPASISIGVGDIVRDRPVFK